MGMIGNSLAQGLISGANIQDGTVDTPDIKDSAVTAAKIASAVITPAKLSTGAPTWDASGNLGLGVTPSAWSSSFRAFQTNGMAMFASNSSGATGYLITNAFWNGTNYIARFTGGASSYVQSAGTHSWNVNGSVTADTAFSFTQAMTLDTSGNLGVGITSPNARLNVQDATTHNGTIWLGSATYYSTIKHDATATGALLFNVATANAGAITYQWQKGGSAQMTLDTSGRLGIGTSSPSVLFHAVGSSSASQIRAGTSTVFTDWGTDATGTYFENTGTSTATRGMRFQAQNGSNSYSSIKIDGGNNSLQFGTSNAERVRINSSGSLLVGTTSEMSGGGNGINGWGVQGAGGDNVYMVIQNKSDANMYIAKNSGYTTGVYVYFYVNGSAVGSISTGGSTTSYNTSSDYRLKEDIQPMTSALQRIAALKPVTYKWKVDGSSGEGFIAHELAEVVPDAVTGEKDAVKEDGSILPQGIDSSFLVATLTAAIQEQQAIIESLTERITALEAN